MAVLSPASSKRNGPSFVTKAPEDVGPEVRGLLSILGNFKASKTHAAIRAALERFDDKAMYDTPFMYIIGKDRIRAICSFFGTFGATVAQPKAVRIAMEPTDKHAVVEMDASADYLPTRTWWVWPSMLLPSKIPHETLLRISLKSGTDKVDSIAERFHNIPALPYLLRLINGSVVGSTLLLLEPLALKAYEIYKNAWVNVTALTSEAASTVQSNVQKRVDNVTDKTS